MSGAAVPSSGAPPRLNRRALVMSGLAVLTAGAGAGAGAAAARDGELRDALAQVLDDSAAAWSRGDLDRFMQAYEDAPGTAYVQPTGLVEGYRAIHDMYAERFAGRGGDMGRLTTTILDVRRLGPDFALAAGRYKLQGANGKTAQGIFTLVFHRSSAGWRIISDHTS